MKCLPAPPEPAGYPRLRPILTRRTILSLLTIGGMLPAMAPFAAEKQLVRREFRAVDTLFANPGQGWMSQARRPQGEPRFPCSVVYIRFNWADAEPEEGQYRWALIDDVIDAWKPRGAAVAMRVMTCNAHSSGYYTSPKWLFDAGCRGFDYERGGDDPTSGGQRISRIEPDYADPIYLAKHGAFLQALGARYDGHPDVEFLDIGSYGIWGEWHTSHAASVAVRKQIVDLYLTAFRTTPLVFMSDDAEVLAYALSRGTGFRRDGVGSPWHEENWIGSRKYAQVPNMGEVWKRSPIVFEWFGNYDYLKSKEWPFDAAVDFMLSNHVTLINDNFGRVPPDAMPQLEKLARLAGARFALKELEHAPSVRPGAPLRITMLWANLGVGRMHRQFKLQVFVLDTAGKPLVTQPADADLRQWLPGNHQTAVELPIPGDLAPGEYSLAVALVDAAHHRPPWRLAMDVPQSDGRYLISQITVADRPRTVPLQ